MPLVTKCATVRLRYDDPDLKAKVVAIRDASAKNPGMTPLKADLAYPDGTILKIDLGPTCNAAVNIGFLSLVAKSVPQNDIDFSPEDKIMLAPKEPKPWE